jgi:cation transport regulator ChaB
MSKRLTPLTVAQRQIDAWEGKRRRLIDQLDEVDAHIRRWEAVRAAMAQDDEQSTARELDGVPQ